jgi:hypothetical protein
MLLVTSMRTWNLYSLGRRNSELNKFSELVILSFFLNTKNAYIPYPHSFGKKYSTIRVIDHPVAFMG